jgi:hypothetical protein
LLDKTGSAAAVKQRCWQKQLEGRWTDHIQYKGERIGLQEAVDGVVITPAGDIIPVIRCPRIKQATSFVSGLSVNLFLMYPCQFASSDSMLLIFAVAVL